jgi:hypothetical protein
LNDHWQIRIYGMKYFNEHEPYWGNTTSHILGAANGRLTARSVKLFTDGVWHYSHLRFSSKIMQALCERVDPL